MPLMVEVPAPTVSLNKLQRMHFHARARLRQSYETIFRLHATRLNRARDREFKHVTVTRYGVKHLDHDNLVGGCKPLIDALERSGLIYSDAPQFLRVEYRQQTVRAGETKTLVTIT